MSKAESYYQIYGDLSLIHICKVSESRHDLSEEEARKIAKIIGLSAIKYGDLSNQASKDYIFDIDRFTSFEGDTGPYILYTIVRIKSILAKYQEQGKSLENLCLEEAQGASEKDLMRQLCSFNAMMDLSLIHIYSAFGHSPFG